MRKTVLIVAIVVMMCGCSSPEEITNHRFDYGDMVIARIDGRRGQIISVRRYYYRYEVRFGAQEATTHTRLISEDEAISRMPYSIILMREFELKRFVE